MERYWNGWSFLSRDSLKIMLGECPEAVPASQIGAHSWFVHVLVERVDELHEIVFAERIPESGQND